MRKRVYLEHSGSSSPSPARKAASSIIMTPSGLVLLTLTFLLILDVLPQPQNKLDCGRFNTFHLTPVSYCNLISFPMCGTDGTTYENPCELCIKIRENKGKLGLRHKGKCQSLLVKLKRTGH